MKKNVREYKDRGVQFAYVLDAINLEKDSATDKERIDYFFGAFENEYNSAHEKRYYPKLQDRVSAYLRGLPSCIAIDFCNSDIAEIGKSWGYCGTPRKESAFIENWFDCIAFRLIQLKKML